MKLKSALLLLLAATIFFSCKKNNDDDDDNDGRNQWDGRYRMEGTMTDHVNANFMWKDNPMNILCKQAEAQPIVLFPIPSVFLGL